MDAKLSLDMIRNLVVLFQYIATAELNIIMMAMSHCTPHPKQRPKQVWRSSTHFFHSFNNFPENVETVDSHKDLFCFLHKN